MSSSERTTVWPEPIWIKVPGWWQIPPQHQSTYLEGPESPSMKIPPFQTSLYKISKVNFFRLTNFFFRNKKFFSKKHFLFSFLCNVKQKQISERSEFFLKIFIFENLLHKKRLKCGISIYADFGPPRYVLWCCGGICYEVLTFFQIGCGHTVYLL
jgi:hypothetical protein